jgi:Brp/Blh family beta-carotene 15,15'-monooxygenase
MAFLRVIRGSTCSPSGADFSGFFWSSFLFAAVYHFGSSDEHPQVLALICHSSLSKALWILSRGAILVFGPVTAYPDKVIEYLSLAAPQAYAEKLCQIAPFFFVYAIFLFLLATFWSWKKIPLMTYKWLLIKHLASISIFVLLFFVAEPLVSFTLYFCCHHSMAHTFRVISRVRKSLSSYWGSIWGVLAIVGVLPIIVWVTSQLSTQSNSNTAVIALFIMVASVTFPHLLVVNELHQALNRLKLSQSPSGKITRCEIIKTIM